MDQPEVRVSVAGYRDLVRVGSGGFSMVYRAYQEAFDRTVAVKVLTVELVDETAQRRFQRECRASGRLSNHPNIVTVLDSGFTDDGRPYITTEFMSHGALSDRLEAQGPYPVAEVLEIGVLMCSALAAVHAAGILHRDIKPQNILISDYGEPALADFGISAITVGPEASIGTSSITPLHVAPEVLEGQPTSPASDVYSLGSTLYMLLAGRAPFQRPDDDALLPLMRRVVMDPMPDIEREDLAPAVNDLLRYSMAKQPFARYTTAIAFGEAIQATQAHLGLPVTSLRKPGSGAGEYVVAPVAATTLDPDPPPAVPAGLVPPDVAEPPVSPTPPSGAIVAPVAAVAVAPAATPGGSGADAVTGGADAAAPGSSAPPTGVAPTGVGVGSAADASGATAPRSRRTGVVVAVAAVVVVLLVAAGLGLRGRGAGTDGTTAGGPASSAGGSSSGEPSGGGSSGAGGTPDTVGPVGVPITPGLRFDVESSGLDTTVPTPGGVLRVAIDSEPATWNPSQSRFYDGSTMVAEAVFDPLAVLTDQGPKPYLASAITPNDTFDAWTIEVPSGRTFHDGTVLDAAAVKANFDRRIANDLMAQPLAPIQAVKVQGSSVIVTMRQPWAAFPVALTGQSGLVAAPATLEAEAEALPIGTGPFRATSREPGTKVQLARNSTYWQPDRPYLEGIDVSIIGTNALRRTAFDAGQVDVALLTDPGAVEQVAAGAGIIQASQALVATVIINTSAAPLDDLRLRQALANAVDRSAVNAAVFDGKAKEAYSFIPPPSRWAGPDTAAQGQDVDRAKEQVAALGSPVSLRLIIGPSAGQRTVAETLRAQWQQVGIEVEVVVQTGDEQLLNIIDGTYQLALWDYATPTDPDESYVWFHTDATPGEFTYNLPRLSDSTVDRGFDTGRQKPALEDRQKGYVEVQKGLVDRVPAIYLAYLPKALAVSSRIVGWQTDTVGGFGRGGAPWATELGFA